MQLLHPLGLLWPFPLTLIYKPCQQDSQFQIDYVLWFYKNLEEENAHDLKETDTHTRMFHRQYIVIRVRLRRRDLHDDLAINVFGILDQVIEKMDFE